MRDRQHGGLRADDRALRENGAQFALDDYSTANASMSLWVRLQRDVVKIDRFFIDDIAKDPLKFQAVRAMHHFAGASGRTPHRWSSRIR